MMRLRRASVIAVLALWASMATAYAESAWVLWERWVVEGRGDSWSAVDREVSEWACNRVREREYAQAVRKGIERNGQALKVSDQTLIVYSCLPDTVDLRGPKGK